jgi:hypothetical protein
VLAVVRGREGGRRVFYFQTTRGIDGLGLSCQELDFDFFLASLLEAVDE